MYDPFDDIRRFWRAMDRMFEELFERPFERIPITRRVSISAGFREPFVDVNETQDELIITAELPGMDKKDIEVNITENELEIRAEKKEEVKREKEGGIMIRRGFTGFRKYLTLPVPVDPDTAKATYKNGVLEIRVKKATKAKGRRVEIQ